MLLRVTRDFLKAEWGHPYRPCHSAERTPRLHPVRFIAPVISVWYGIVSRETLNLARVLAMCQVQGWTSPFQSDSSCIMPSLTSIFLFVRPGRGTLATFVNCCGQYLPWCHLRSLCVIICVSLCQQTSCWFLNVRMPGNGIFLYKVPDPALPPAQARQKSTCGERVKWNSSRCGGSCPEHSVGWGKWISVSSRPASSWTGSKPAGAT